mmetsp:Transcript_67422/g.186866  ORF Transcript_67422/g.186866 Transcript_67422/m.186866 type:complete len:200 (+) Transcript_67422:932-1531(+)
MSSNRCRKSGLFVDQSRRRPSECAVRRQPLCSRWIIRSTPAAAMPAWSSSKPRACHTLPSCSPPSGPNSRRELNGGESERRETGGSVTSPSKFRVPTELGRSEMRLLAAALAVLVPPAPPLPSLAVEPSRVELPAMPSLSAEAWAFPPCLLRPFGALGSRLPGCCCVSCAGAGCAASLSRYRRALAEAEEVSWIFQKTT